MVLLDVRHIALQRVEGPVPALAIVAVVHSGFLLMTPARTGLARLLDVPHASAIPVMARGADVAVPPIAPLQGHSHPQLERVLFLGNLPSQAHVAVGALGAVNPTRPIAGRASPPRGFGEPDGPEQGFFGCLAPSAVVAHWKSLS